MIAEAIARMSEDVADYPNPDLAVEVDISPSKIDRPGIYAALGVAEVWRYDGKLREVVIEPTDGRRDLPACERKWFLAGSRRGG